MCSSEGKSIVEDNLSEVAAHLLAAYDGGELLAALEEGHAGWQKWVKGFGKTLKRKVSLKGIHSSLSSCSSSAIWNDNFDQPQPHGRANHYSCP